MRSLLTIFSILILYVAPAKTQPIHAGLLPEVSLSYAWTESIRQTIKIESMHQVYGAGASEFAYAYDQTDIQMFVEGRLNPFFRIAAGYQYRLEGGGENSHRLIQQAAFLQRMTGFRLGHRLRTDQSLYASDAMKLRLRYRLSLEIPLEGQSLDAGEFYLLFSGEPIYSLQDAVSDLETRLVGSLGYFINSSSKLEAGPDYRVEGWLDGPVRQNLWLRVGWFYSI